MSGQNSDGIQTKWVTVQEMQEKKAFKAHFNPDSVKEWPAIIAKSHKGDTDAFCRLCRVSQTRTRSIL